MAEFRKRGPREWAPGIDPDLVPTGLPGEWLQPVFVRKIESEKGLPTIPTFRRNAETALYRKDPVELFHVFEIKPSSRRKIGELLWWPKIRRGGVLFNWNEQDGDAHWTDADSPHEILERWLVDEMTE